MKTAVALLMLGGLLATAPVADAHTLTYSRAKAAVQARANSLAGQATVVNTVQRSSIPRRGHSAHAYYAQARWTYVDPTGCKGCAVAPDGLTLIDGPTTVSCFAEFGVRFRSTRSRSVVVSVQSKSCA